MSNCEGEEDLPCCPSSNFPVEFFKTPANSDTPHNFGLASPLDTILYTACKPGKTACNDGNKKVSNERVQEWCKYIISQGVTNVITLLNDDELQIYEEPGLKAMLEHCGMKSYIAPMGDTGACARSERREGCMSLLWGCRSGRESRCSVVSSSIQPYTGSCHLDCPGSSLQKRRTKARSYRQVKRVAPTE
jgi:hypothetical protein